MSITRWHTKYCWGWYIKPPMIMLFRQLMMTLKNRISNSYLLRYKKKCLLKRCELAESKDDDDERLLRWNDDCDDLQRNKKELFQMRIHAILFVAWLTMKWSYNWTICIMMMTVYIWWTTYCWWWRWMNTKWWWWLILDCCWCRWSIRINRMIGNYWIE